MSWTGSLIAIAVIMVVASIFSSQLSALAKDQTNIFNEILRDEAVKIPTPKPGTQVYDLVVTVSPRWKANCCFGPDPVLYLNSDGGTIERTWKNPHKSLSWLDMFSWVDLFQKPRDLQTYEIVVPNSYIEDYTFTLSYVLVDPDTDLQIRIGKYQDVSYTIAAGTGEANVVQKIIFKDLVKKDYELWITPDDNVHFYDHASGQPYKQKITG